MDMNETAAQKIGRYRWVICTLLLFSTTINYMDRQVISYLKEYFCTPMADGGFGWTNTEFAYVTSGFTAFYAGMTILVGWIIDKIGTKLGLALSLIVWSIFGILNAFVGRLAVAHVVIRSLFGIGEAGNFPASIRTVAEWFPKRERALATGIFNSGANLGAMISALFVPWCLIHWGDAEGWKMAYILTGVVGFPWLIFWFWLYETPGKQKRLAKAEYDYIHSDKDEGQAAPTGDKPRTAKSGGLFSFKGRVSRASFWGLGVMIGILSLFVWLLIVNILRAGAQFNSVFLAIVVVMLAVASWAGLALQARRWHDLGKSGWMVMVNLIPVVGSLISLYILGLRQGDSGANKFGDEAGPSLLGYRQTWSFFVGKFMTDGVWWFYLFWLPDYLKKEFQMSKAEIMLPTFIVYGIAIVGSIYGGAIPMTLMKKGMAVYKARMTAMLIIAVFPLSVLATQFFANKNIFGGMASTLAVAMICIGAAAHQAWSANLFTTVSDMFPKRAVASVTGIGAMAGGIGGVLVQILAGRLTDSFVATPSTAYLIMFIVCAGSYLMAWGLMKALVPQHRPITDL
jgi:MFS family permease